MNVLDSLCVQPWGVRLGLEPKLCLQLRMLVGRSNPAVSANLRPGLRLLHHSPAKLYL